MPIKITSTPPSTRFLSFLPFTHHPHSQSSSSLISHCCCHTIISQATRTSSTPPPLLDFVLVTRINESVRQRRGRWWWVVVGQDDCSSTTTNTVSRSMDRHRFSEFFSPPNTPTQKTNRGAFLRAWIEPTQRRRRGQGAREPGHCSLVTIPMIMGI